MARTTPGFSGFDDILNASRSRDATDLLLARLRVGRYRPRAWMEFATAVSLRSVEQARGHPLAFWEVTALHAVLGLAADKRHRVWVAVSWTLAASHLGLLEQTKALGIPNTATLIRANLPAVEHRLHGWAPVLALASDFLDGAIARKTGKVTVFGKNADFLADTAFWTWFTIRHEPSRMARVLSLTAWAAPVAAIVGASFISGRMVDLPRSRWMRPSAAVEIIVGTRAIRRLATGAAK